jgi:hypothetical protein
MGECPPQFVLLAAQLMEKFAIFGSHASSYYVASWEGHKSRSLLRANSIEPMGPSVARMTNF